jgi:hypothetical protein
MKNLVGVLLAAVVCVVLYRVYLTQAIPAGGATPHQTVAVTGVKNDLLVIAQAERAYQAEHGAYTSLDDLRTSGALTMPAGGRDGYIYAAEPSQATFRVRATCPGSTTQPCTGYYVDQTMEVRALP